MTGIIQDLRYAVRGLTRNPGFTTVAVLTLALGIGATTAMFSVVNGVLLRPLPYPQQDRLVELVHQAPGIGFGELFASPATYFAYRDHSRRFESVGLWDWDSSPVTVTGSGDPEAVQSVEVTHEVLPILGANLVMGRSFAEADDVRGSAPTAIISYAYWQRRFGGGDALGRTLIIDGTPRQIVGVLGQSFTFFDYAADIFYPLQPVRSTATFPSFDGRGIARLKPGVTIEQANADVARMIPILIEQFGSPGQGLPKNAQFGPKLRTLRETIIGDLTDTLWLLMGTIGLLLVIACANVANLVLVRAQTRRAELAIRTALGARWTALARVVFTESAVLGLVGGLTGVGFAYFSLPVLLSFAAADLPHIMTVKVDPIVLLVAFAASMCATFAFAFMPLFHFALPDLPVVAGLRSEMRSATEGRESNRTRHVLVISQVALALLLLIGSALMARTFYMLRQVDPGFRDPHKVQTFQVTIPSTVFSNATQGAEANRERTLRMQQAILDRLAAVPGVQSVGFATFNDGLPMDGDGRQMSILPIINGRAAADGVTRTWEMQRVSPGFFETLRTPLVAGRTLQWSDIYSENSVMLVSENLARKEWGSATAALGNRIFFVPSRGSEIVGVVKDVHHHGVNQPAPETVIFRAIPSDTATFVVRSERAGTTSLERDLRNAVWSINGTLSLANSKTLGDLYQRSTARTSLTLQLLAITGVMALLLGLVGIYGVVSYAIAQRRREIGIRVALGAEQGEVRGMFVRHALVLVGIGVTIGLAAALGLTRLMESQLFGISPLDPFSYVAVSSVLLLGAAVASYLPARRAARVDPIVALRYE